MRGDRNEPPACKTCGERIETGGERRLAIDPRLGREQCVDHGVAGDMNAIGGDVFGAQGLCGGFGWREMQVGDRACALSVHSLGPGMIDFAVAPPPPAKKKAELWLGKEWFS